VNHHRRSAQVWRMFSRDFTVLSAHPRSSAIGMSHTCLCLASYNWYSFTDPGRMEGWVDHHHRLLRHTTAKQNTKHAQTSLKSTDKTVKHSKTMTNKLAIDSYTVSILYDKSVPYTMFYYILWHKEWINTIFNKQRWHISLFWL